MKAIAPMLILSLLVGFSLAEAKVPANPPAKPLMAEVQVPFSFLPPSHSIFADSSLKSVPNQPKPEVITKPAVLVAEPQKPLRSSDVEGINPTQAKGLAGEIVRFLASQYPADSTTILLPITTHRKLKTFNAVLELALHQQGFAVSRVAVEDAVPLSYQIVRHDREILVKLRINRTEINRLYQDDLVILSPFTILKDGGQSE